MNRLARFCGLLVSALAPAAYAQVADDNPSLSLSAAYTGDLRRNGTGGLAVGTAYADALDLGVAWSTNSLFSTATMTTNLSVMYLGGDAISGEFVGDLQGLNNIEAPSGWRLYESWVEFNFGGHANTLRAGVLDLNAEFDTPVTTDLFIGSPFGIGTDLSQTGERGPTVWPVTGLGVRAAGEYNQNLRWRFGAYDGAPGTDQDSFTSTQISTSEGALLIGELEYVNERFHKIALGAWSYTSAFERVDAATRPPAAPHHGNRGFYAALDLALGSPGDVELNGALRAGAAPSQFNTFDHYIGGAVTASHLWASRPGDSLGLGIAYAHAGEPYRAQRSFDGQPATSAETLVELVYRAELTPWLTLLPNVQFVRDPGADAALGDAWVAGLRFEVSHERSWQLSAGRKPSPDDSYASAQALSRK